MPLPALGGACQLDRKQTPFDVLLPVAPPRAHN